MLQTSLSLFAAAPFRNVMPLALRVVALLACFVGVPSDGAGNDRPPTGGPAFFRSSTLPSTVSDDIIINKEVHIPVAVCLLTNKVIPSGLDLGAHPHDIRPWPFRELAMLHL